jgi:hypothetical protein
MGNFCIPRNKYEEIEDSQCYSTRTDMYMKYNENGIAFFIDADNISFITEVNSFIPAGTKIKIYIAPCGYKVHGRIVDIGDVDLGGFFTVHNGKISCIKKGNFIPYISKL